MSNSLWPYGLQRARLLCPPLSPRVCSKILISLPYWIPVKAVDYIKKSLRLGDTFISFISHFIWKNHNNLLAVYKNRTFYKQQVGGALAAGFDGFSMKFSLSVACKYISVNFVKIALICSLKSQDFGGRNVVFLFIFRCCLAPILYLSI